MKIAINYADSTFSKAQMYNTQTAYKVGKFDKVIQYSPESIDKKFLEKNKEYFVTGNLQIGKYGLWRPLILKDAYLKAQMDDYIFYCDSGTYFVNDIEPLINIMVQKNLSVLVFELPFIERHWTKRDVFKVFNVDNEEVVNSNQRMSTAFIIKKCVESDKIVEEFYEAALQHPELFTDEDNKLGSPNYEGFIQNRHNQSVLSVITKKHHISAYRDITEYGIRPNLYKCFGLKSELFNINNHPESDYPQILVQHRRGTVTKIVKFYGFIRSKMPIWFSNTFIKVLVIRYSIKKFLFAGK